MKTRKGRWSLANEIIEGQGRNSPEMALYYKNTTKNETTDQTTNQTRISAWIALYKKDAKLCNFVNLEETKNTKTSCIFHLVFFPLVAINPKCFHFHIDILGSQIINAQANCLIQRGIYWQINPLHASSTPFSLTRTNPFD